MSARDNRNSYLNLATPRTVSQIKTMTRQWSRGEKWLMFGSGSLCLFVLVLGWIYQYQNELPPPPAQIVEIPPVNNAFDVLTQAATLMPPRPTPRYGPGTCKASNIDREYTCDYGNSQPPPYTPRYSAAFPLSRKTAYLKSAQKSLNLWRSSINLPLYVPSGTPSYEFRRVGESFRELAFVQARFCWQNGDANSALNWLLFCHRDMCRTTRTFFNGGFHATETNSLWGVSHARTLDELEGLMPYLNAAQLQRAALAIGRDRASIPSRTEAARRAKQKDMARVYRACVANDVLLLLNPNRELSTEGVWPLRFRWANKKRGIEMVDSQWNWIIKQTQKSYSGSAVPEVAPPEIRASTNDPFKLAEPYWNFGSNASIEAREVVLMTAMAVRGFALHHGNNPRTLGQLVPLYLQKVEADPFNSPHPLHYAPTGKTYLQFRFGAPIYTKPLPKDAIRWNANTMYAPANFPNRQALKGLHTFTTKEQLPFLVYSVGYNGRDDGGMNFDKARENPNSYSSAEVAVETCDDILAPSAWFNVSAFPEFSKVSPFADGGPAP